MDKNDIELAARDLQLQIWSQRAEIWPGMKELSVVDIVDPKIAARVLGIDFQLHPELRWFIHPLASLEETAGILDREGRRILVSTKFPFETQRFTAAHEIGHWLLHGEMVMHRDRPISGLTEETFSRPPQERQADYFAASFLMPRKRVTEAFQFVFSMRASFVFDDAAAFEQCPDDPDSLLRPYDGSLSRALSLASARHYRGRHFLPLYQQFRVSVTTMAIRLKELGLMQD